MHERHCGISYHCRARVHTLLCCLKEDVRGASTDLRQQRRLLQLRPRDGERRRSLLLGLMSTYREHLAHTRAANEFFGGQNCGKRTCSKATQMRSITPILAAGESSSEALTAGTSSAATNHVCSFLCGNFVLVGWMIVFMVGGLYIQLWHKQDSMCPITHSFFNRSNNHARDVSRAATAAVTAVAASAAGCTFSTLARAWPHA